MKPATIHSCPALVSTNNKTLLYHAVGKHKYSSNPKKRTKAIMFTLNAGAKAIRYRIKTYLIYDSPL